ncbi:CsbD family protein [Methylobacterium durans]|uniref:CsbD family protein n=1 Tax=Methylobacterium durans TaxID=2202825 RepID=UPI002AFDE6E6|nr:CsbD family protein [Methylobacterium durans]MEA1831088.1 CsbD family protein [Methylobacterium durans]
MNRDRVEGGIRHLRGRAKTAVGAVAGRPLPQVEGAIDQVAGTAQYAYGQARETARDLRRDGAHLAAEAGRRGRDVAEDLEERGQRYRNEAVRRGRAVARRAEDNKTATLLLVAAAAFSLGWLTRRAR